MISTSTPAEQRTLLRNISWQTFESLLSDLGEHRSSRLTYNRGTLEIMTPLYEHEKPKEVLTALIGIIVEELNIEIARAGSTTFKRQELGRGAEPDSSFYIQNERLVRGKSKIDLRNDPPPDLVIEIDITSSSLDSFDIYSALGVPEIWRYNGRVLQFFQFQDEEYVACEFSRVFSFLSVAEMGRFLQESKTVGETTLLRGFRVWVRSKIISG
ncbi:Uma2 family endonuclease [Kamptonema animale CS-326]|jgi:Uma2 family endonuclease|uniref:Uma2 family endonuclease n=1 Tax=Kamptonema animale TaxID=92934 RepID=UPI00232D9C6E|nr:Uma2 family endonuclease [Kamptonema animale]MDB9513359.1 Uma2 family endonuclease [Kamptonema animale CS-326]